jgi:hypothetical protein
MENWKKENKKKRKREKHKVKKFRMKHHFPLPPSLWALASFPEMCSST